MTLRVGRGCDVSDGFTADVRPTRDASRLRAGQRLAGNVLRYKCSAWAGSPCFPAASVGFNHQHPPSDDGGRLRPLSLLPRISLTRHQHTRRCTPTLH